MSNGCASSSSSAMKRERPVSSGANPHRCTASASPPTDLRQCQQLGRSNVDIICDWTYNMSMSYQH